METKNFVAIDLGATSGRVILGAVDGQSITLREIARFPNNMVQCSGHCYWDILYLYGEIIKGLKQIGSEYIAIESIGIDTWGVDFACIGADGLLLGNPMSYRDPHTYNAMSWYLAANGQRQVYEVTGIQFMYFNTLYQLAAMRDANNSVLANAKHLLFLPDAFAYLLTGEMVTEYTIASTSQLINPRTKTFDKGLLESVDLDVDVFAPIVHPGAEIGELLPEVLQCTDLDPVPVIAVAGHDTASAVASIPAEDSNFAFLSSGTWSLMGIETDTPIINDASFRYAFTNEGGVEGTTTFLKNICGMWLLEECRREWSGDISYETLIAESEQVPHFRSLINPDARCFANPKRMTAAIKKYCEDTNQKEPYTKGEFVRCIFDSLAFRYRQVFDMLKKFANFPLERLHIIGGGSRNGHLCQLTANALQVPVVAGPVEGTAIGNIMIQAKAAGLVGSIEDMRSMISRSIKTETFTPMDKEAWEAGYEKYLQVYREDI